MLKPFPQPPPKTVRDRPEHHLNSEAMENPGKKREVLLYFPDVECDEPIKGIRSKTFSPSLCFLT
jgi:hypothetical protein